MPSDMCLTWRDPHCERVKLADKERGKNNLGSGRDHVLLIWFPLLILQLKDDLLWLTAPPFGLLEALQDCCYPLLASAGSDFSFYLFLIQEDTTSAHWNFWQWIWWKRQLCIFIHGYYREQTRKGSSLPVLDVDEMPYHAVFFFVVVVFLSFF